MRMNSTLTGLFLGVAGIALVAGTSLAQPIDIDNTDFTTDNATLDPATTDRASLPISDYMDTDNVFTDTAMPGNNTKNPRENDPYEVDLGKQLFGKPFSKAARMELQWSIAAAKQAPMVKIEHVDPVDNTGTLEKIANMAAKGVDKMDNEGKRYGPIREIGARIINAVLN